MNNIYCFLKTKKNALLCKLRVLKYYYFFKSIDIQIGANLRIISGRGSHKIGRNFKIFDNAIIECHEPTSSLITGENCIFSFGVLCCINTKIILGNHVWVGEYSSLRNSTHSFSVKSPLGTMRDIWGDIVIGNNVWIGRGCLILPNTIIGDNVIVAANSVVKGQLLSNSLYGGCPAKFIKFL